MVQKVVGQSVVAGSQPKKRRSPVLATPRSKSYRAHEGCGRRVQLLCRHQAHQKNGVLAAYRSQDVAVLRAGLGLEAGTTPVLDDDGSGGQTRLVSDKRLK